MDTLTKRATIHFDPAVYEVLEFQAKEYSQSISSIVHEALLAQFAEDEEDIRACEERRNEPTISFEEVTRRLKADGKL